MHITPMQLNEDIRSEYTGIIASARRSLTQNGGFHCGAEDPDEATDHDCNEPAGRATTKGRREGGIKGGGKQ